MSAGIDHLIRKLAERETAAATISEAEITACCESLRELGYTPTVNQVAKVFIGSRSIADPRLRAVPSYRKYRGLLTRRAIRDLLGRFEELIRGPRQLRASRDEAWRTVDFFDAGDFDKLSDSKATELYREVEQLGLRKVTENLPRLHGPGPHPRTPRLRALDAGGKGAADRGHVLHQRQ